MPVNLLSVLWRHWLGGRKGIRPEKKLSGGVLAWLSVWRKAQICIWPRWCHCHSLSLAPVNRDWFTYLVLANLGSPRQRTIKRVLLLLLAMPVIYYTKNLRFWQSKPQLVEKWFSLSSITVSCSTMYTKNKYELLQEKTQIYITKLNHCVKHNLLVLHVWKSGSFLLIISKTFCISKDHAMIIPQLELVRRRNN